MTNKLVAVIGAGGATGKPLIEAFEKHRMQVRVMTRRIGKSRRFPDTVDVREGNLLDRASLAKALRGADSIHYIPPSFDLGEQEYARNLIEVAEDLGVRRLVYHSVLHSMTPDMPHHLRKAEVELLLRRSRLHWTIIQPAMYAQTVLAYFDAYAGELLPAFDTMQPFTPVHLGDLSEAAAIIHLQDGHEFATYELAGPEILTFDAMAERLSEVLQRPINARKEDMKVLANKAAAARSFSEDQVRELCMMCEHYDRYGLLGNSNVLGMLLGREPTNFIDAMRQSQGG